MKSQTSATHRKIQAAIDKKLLGIDKIMDKEKDLELPKLELPKLIKERDIKTENAKNPACVLNLKPALPPLMAFEYEASKGHPHRAVASLFDVLDHLPEISEHCVRKEVKLPDNKPDNKKCVKDIEELHGIVSDLVEDPLKVIDNEKKMKKLICMVPECISHCTSAFE